MSAPRFDIGIHCGTFLSMAGGAARPESDIFLGIRGQEIELIAPWDSSRVIESKEFIDASDQVVLPSFVNGHTHLAMSLFRGMEDDLPFEKWLFDRILPLESQFVDSEFVQVGTELAALESIRFGVTTVCDMYFYPESVASVLDRSGMRGMVSQVWSGFPLPEDKDLGRDKRALFESFFAKWRSHERITPILGPHTPYTCTEEQLREVADLAAKTGARVHIHVSETEGEVLESLKKHSKTPVQYLFDLNLLNRQTICAHCVHLNEADIAILKASGASVVHNPDSNLKLSSGIAPVSRYLAEGIPVALGTDGAASNNDLSLFGAMDLATKLQKFVGKSNTAMIAEQALVCATIGGAKALGLDDRIGSLEVGKRADLVVVDFAFPHLQPVHSVISQLVYSTQGLEVDTVICDGKVLMKGKKVLTIDFESLMHRVAVFRDKIGAALESLRISS
ncbi:MAG TPA: amidohydrolase [Bdellovibrionota bacterium]|nr:amidohydrolase [Bdellovibrionota bacterium]